MDNAMKENSDDYKVEDAVNTPHACRGHQEQS
jgi:hypothetical protein